MQQHREPFFSKIPTDHFLHVQGGHSSTKSHGLQPTSDGLQPIVTRSIFFHVLSAQESWAEKWWEQCPASWLPLHHGAVSKHTDGRSQIEATSNCVCLLQEHVAEPLSPLESRGTSHRRLPWVTRRSSSVEAIALRLEAITTSNKKLLVAPGLTTRNKKLLVTKVTKLDVSMNALEQIPPSIGRLVECVSGISTRWLASDRSVRFAMPGAPTMP